MIALRQMKALPRYGADPFPSRLSSTQKADFQQNGFLVFENALTKNEVDKGKKELSRLINMAFRRARDGDPEFKLSELYRVDQNPCMGIFKTTSQFHIQYEPGYNPLTGPDSAELRVRKLNGYCTESPFFKNLLGSEKIQRLLREFIGPHPVQFQDMALIKPPRGGVPKHWHQDAAYFKIRPLSAIVGIWIALDRATKENGCMRVIPGGHNPGPVKHIHRNDCEIAPGRILTPSAVDVEISP